MTQSSLSSNKSISFPELNLVSELTERLQELGYLCPTMIQQAAIPAILAGKDLQAQAETGSGKTAAFALPILQQLAEKTVTARGSNWIGGLVLVPTRELAEQVAASFISYSHRYHGAVKVKAVYGGVSVNSQMQALKNGADVLVATPGRLLDLLSKNVIKLDKLKYLVLDEADRLLSLGFSDELAALKQHLPGKKQTLLFSATFPEEVLTLTAQLLNQPVLLGESSAKPEMLQQRVIEVNRRHKTDLLIHLLQQQAWQQVLVFASAKVSCNRLQTKLKEAGIEAKVFHGDKTQGNRTRILDGFKNGEIQVLIATDIAARGIDIDKLPVVINFELPRSPADYLHRIGRTGRAGKQGLALSLISHDEYQHFKLIEKKNKLKLTRENIVGFEADIEAPADCPSRQAKPVAKPAGTGKKNRKKLAQVNADIWQKK